MGTSCFSFGSGNALLSKGSSHTLLVGKLSGLEGSGCADGRESSQLGSSLLSSEDSCTLNSELMGSQFSGTDASEVRHSFLQS